jgi:hypothetical protein
LKYHPSLTSFYKTVNNFIPSSISLPIRSIKRRNSPEGVVSENTSQKKLPASKCLSQSLLPGELHVRQMKLSMSLAKLVQAEHT